VIKSLLSALCGLMLLGACAKHNIEHQSFVPVDTFSGRLLVMATTKRFQVDIDWQGDEQKGALRLTHASSGRIVDVLWEHETMFWRDNKHVGWRPLTEKELEEKGVLLPPWVLARIFMNDMPSSMETKDKLAWKGSWIYKETTLDLSIRWASDRKRVELKDLKHGKKLVVIINE